VGRQTGRRAATTGTSIGDTWIASGFTLHDNGGAETWPSFYWLGRQRDDPFTPSWVTSYSNSYTEGVSANDDTGVFYGPSNCACDYTVSNGWGDGTSGTPSLNNYAPGYFLLFGPHAYAEEGNDTTAMTATDSWGQRRLRQRVGLGRRRPAPRGRGNHLRRQGRLTDQVGGDVHRRRPGWHRLGLPRHHPLG
jgi:hypothetical protein